jgi:hypothetical protein
LAEIGGSWGRTVITDNMSNNSSKNLNVKGKTEINSTTDSHGQDRSISEMISYGCDQQPLCQFMVRYQVCRESVLETVFKY